MKEFISRLTWVDYVAALAVLRGCYVGYRSGFFPELLRIAAYLVTVVVTFHFNESFAQFLTLKTFLNYATAKTLSFGGLLLVVFFLTKLLIMLLLRLLKLGEGGFFYRLLGVGVGACRWVLLLSLLFMAIEYSPLGTLKTDIQDRSLTGAKIARIAPMIFDFLSNLSPRLGTEEKEVKAA